MNSVFLSDNTAPADKRILDYMMKANDGFAKSYGNDRFTNEAEKLVKAEFGDDASFFPVLTGTGANVVSLSSMLMPFQSIICPETAHINVDECGAPERFLGSKIVSVPQYEGKISVKDILPTLDSIGFEHHAQPAVISISQVTEVGTAYSTDELKEISDFAKNNGLLLHIDGSRIANAAAYLGVSLREACLGADVLSFGGTKNGMMMGEAVIVLNKDISLNTKYIRKQSMQLFSKMRYLSAQFIPYLKDGIWLENAQHANKMAKMLADGLKEYGIDTFYPVNSNGVFPVMEAELVNKLEKEFGFYVWDKKFSVARFMCSFATQTEDIEAVLSSVKEYV
jgi:threonine aldolase